MTERAAVRLTLAAIAVMLAHPPSVHAQATATPAEEPAVTPDEATESAPSNSRHEQEGVTYRSIGIGYRHSFVPPGIIEVAVANAPRGIRIPQLALEYARRLDGFQLTASLTYQDFGFHGAFRSNGDTQFEYEWLDSNLKSVGVGVGATWSSHFSDVFAIEGGMDFGLGALFGHVTRTEAYPSLGNNPNSGGGFGRCSAPTTPGGFGSDGMGGADFDSNHYGSTTGTLQGYCGQPASGYTDPDVRNGEQYGVHYHNWLHGGSMPFISWRLAPRLSFRFKPAAHFILRIDSGFDFGSGIFVGSTGLSTGAHLHLEVADRPGVLARVATVLGDHEISVKSVVQRGIGEDARLVMVVHECLESRFAAAVAALGELDDMRAPARYIHVIEEGA